MEWFHHCTHTRQTRDGTVPELEEAPTVTRHPRSHTVRGRSNLDPELLAVGRRLPREDFLDGLEPLLEPLRLGLVQGQVAPVLGEPRIVDRQPARRALPEDVAAHNLERGRGQDEERLLAQRALEHGAGGLQRIARSMHSALRVHDHVLVGGVSRCDEEQNLRRCNVGTMRGRKSEEDVPKAKAIVNFARRSDGICVHGRVCVHRDTKSGGGFASELQSCCTERARMTDRQGGQNGA